MQEIVGSTTDVSTSITEDLACKAAKESMFYAIRVENKNGFVSFEDILISLIKMTV